MRTKLLPITALLLLAEPVPAHEQASSPACDNPKEIASVVAVTPLGTATGLVCLDDGDSFSIGPAWVRLKGVDAPRVGRNCIRWFGEGRQLPRRCELGLEMLAQLGDLLAAGARCVAEKRDGLHRWLATCTTADGRDVSSEMARRGFACATTRYESTYLSIELEARRAGRGLWASDSGYVPSKMCRLGR